MPDLPTQAVQRRLYRWFEISVFLKGLNAVLEITGGLFALLVPAEFVQDIATYFTAEELGQDPHDFIATHLVQWANAYATGAHQLFVALYLFSHGVIKLGLVFALLKGKLWAYPAALAIFGLFTLYEAYLVAIDHSLAIALFALFDLIVIWFVWREWQVVKQHQA